MQIDGAYATTTMHMCNSIWLVWVSGPERSDLHGLIERNAGGLPRLSCFCECVIGTGKARGGPRRESVTDGLLSGSGVYG